MEKSAALLPPEDTVVGAGRFHCRPVERWAIPANREFGEIPGVACDSQDRVYLFARGTRMVHRFAADGTSIDSWGEGLFQRPHGIFIGPDDTVYCTDDVGHSVCAFTPEGRLRFALQATGKPSDTGATSMDYRTIQRAAGPFHYPTNLAIAPAGDLYVADGYGNARIHRFAADGQYRESWGAPGSGRGEFNIPHGIAIDADEIIYVADRENSRIQRFDLNGRFVDEWRDVARPCQVFIDPDGWVYVAELGFYAGRWSGTGAAQPGDPGGRVSVFDRTGVLHARWGGGTDPTAAGDFFAPHDICVDSRGAIYVAEVTLSGGGRAGLVPTSCHTLQKFAPVNAIR
jgi:DNA-binding beta-propeller fold protein YncE